MIHNVNVAAKGKGPDYGTPGPKAIDPNNGTDENESTTKNEKEKPTKCNENLIPKFTLNALLCSLHIYNGVW